MLDNIKKNIKYSLKITLSWLFVIVWASIIFYLSSRTAPQSTVQSQGVISIFARIFGKIIEDENLMTWIDGIVRESAHGVEYFILGLLVFNALYLCLNYRKQEELLLTAETGIECTDKYRMFNCIICAILICTLYSLSDEIHQIPVPGRTFQLMDLGIDLIGTTLGVIAIALIYKLKKK